MALTKTGASGFVVDVGSKRMDIRFIPTGEGIARG
jgi:hypothetical protein